MGSCCPKAESAEQVQWVSAQITAAEERFGWSAGEIALIIQIETAAGLVNIREVLSADPRLQAVIFGAETWLPAWASNAPPLAGRFLCPQCGRCPRCRF